MFRCLFEHCPEYSYMEDNNPFNHSSYTDNTTLQSWFLRRNHSNEVVVAYMYDKSKDIYYCFDTYSRMLYVKGRESLERITVPGKPARLKTELKLNLQTTLEKGSTVWLTGFNPATKSATILIENNQKVDVPMNDLHLLPEYESVPESDYSWKPVSSTNNKD
ncbi:MAG: hypothetical protein NZ455_04175 [Bacteroidia bacterium]|nr:hypothetical protein [Bacteroidia bacterium]MDW8302784.1 hypothetical protein [Bacteroidia bacterium]